MLDPDRFTQIPLGMQMASVVRHWRSVVDAHMQPLNLTQSRWELMAQLERLGDGVIQSELAAALGIEMPSLTRSLEQLEQQGVIKRRRSHIDGRARTVHFTAKGRELQQRATSVRHAVKQEIQADIPEQELATFQHVLLILAGNLDRIEHKS